MATQSITISATKSQLSPATPADPNSVATVAQSPLTGSNSTTIPPQINISASQHIPISAAVSSSSAIGPSSSTMPPTGNIFPSETYTHESGFVLNGKIYSFKLNIPIQTQPQDSEKDRLNKAIQTYKDQFIGHLKKQNLDIVKSGKAFDIEFQGERGYTLSQVQNSQSTSLEQKVHNDEAKQFANLICTSNQDAKFITSLLENPSSYPQQLPVTPAPTGTTPTPSPSNTSPASSSPEENDNTGSPPPAQNPTSAAPSQVAPPKIGRGQNTCFAASVLWYLHNDAEILTALPSAISSAQNEEKLLLEKLKTLLEEMQKGQDIPKKDIEAFIQSLAAVKSKSQIKVAIGQTGDAREIIDYFQKKILGNKRLNIPRDGGDQNNSIELKAKENSTKIQGSFEVTQDPNQLSDSIPLELILEGTTYKLTRALCHSGNDTNGHYTVLVAASDGTYYYCDDVEKINPKVVTKEKADQLLREKAVKLLYVKQPASPAASISQSSKTPSVDNNLISDSLNQSGATISYHTKKRNESQSEYTIQSSSSCVTIPYKKELKTEIARIVLEEERTDITLNASEEEIQEIRSYVKRVCFLNESSHPGITSKNGNLTFEAPSTSNPKTDYATQEQSEGVKPSKSDRLIDYFESLLQIDIPADHEIIFNLRNQLLGKNEFSSGTYELAQKPVLFLGEEGGDNSNEQKTLDSFLEAIFANPLPKDRKIRLIISKDILIKNFEKIEAALSEAAKLLESSTVASSNNEPSNNSTSSNAPSSEKGNKSNQEDPSEPSSEQNLSKTFWNSYSRITSVLLNNSITGG